MSLPGALKTAVIARLVGDGGLAALIGIDPNDNTTPAVLVANKDTRPPVFPCLTVKEEIGQRDQRFRAPPGAGESPSAVFDTYYQFTFWTQSASGLVAYDVQDRLTAIFQGQAFAITGGWAFDCQEMTFATDNWHSQFNAYFTLFRYRFRTQKAG